MIRLSTHRFLGPRAALAAAALAAAVVASAPRVAAATPSLADKATAQALFEDALQLMGAHKFVEACPKLEESERLDPALGTRYRLSECEEAVGRLASAWAGFLEVADLAHAAGQADREKTARQRAAVIEPKLSRIRVVVDRPDTPGLEVAHDHTVVGRGQWGTPVPIDPGTYTITATAPGKKPWRGSVTVVDTGATVSLTVPSLDDVPPEPARPAPLSTPAAQPSPPAPSHLSTTEKVAGFGMIGVGAAGLVTSGILGLVARSNYDGAGANCGASACNASGKSTIDSARQLANVATAVGVAGAVVGVAGVVVLLVAPRTATHEGPAAALRVGPTSVLLTGSF
jgi:hypothetical protein